MKALTNHVAPRQFQGFVVHVLNNDEVELVALAGFGRQVTSMILGGESLARESRT